MFTLPDTDPYTNYINAKLGTVAIGIGIGIGIGVGVGPVETLLYIIIEPTWLCLCKGIGTEIGVGQCKHIITPNRQNTICFSNRYRSKVKHQFPKESISGKKTPHFEIVNTKKFHLF